MTKGKRISKEDKRMMEDLRKAGNSYREIHEEIGVPFSTISRYCRFIEPEEERKADFPCKDSYKNRWARKHGYASFSEYQKELYKKRKAREENQRMAKLIVYGLERVRKTQKPPKFQKGYSWLAERIGTTHKAAGLYASGALLPRSEIAEKIFKALGIEGEIPKASGEKSAEHETITINDLALAIKSSRSGMEDEGAEQIAEVVMNQFGFTDVILDNSLESDVRDVFYNLEDEGLLGSESEEISLYSGKAWRIKYWALRKEKILKLAKTHDNATSSADEDFSGVYGGVSNEDWIGGLRAIDREGEEESVA